MSSINAISRDSAPVLVTGVSGFIASHVVHQLLEKGYTVRGTVRSAKKIDYLRKKFASAKDRLEFVVVPDMTSPGAFVEAVRGVVGILHVASPFFSTEVTDPNAQLIEPAVRGTLNILEAANYQGTTVRRIVITSSFGAIINLDLELPHTFTELEWNTTSTVEMGGIHAYRASKTLAERSAWDFIHDTHPPFDIVTTNPTLVFGPVLHQVDRMEDLNASVKMAYDCLTGAVTSVSCVTAGWVDVRDVARAHVLALETPTAAGRYLVSAGDFTWQEAADLLREMYPSEKVPVGTPGTRIERIRTDSSKSKKELGLDYIGLRQSLKDMCDQLLEMRKERN